MKRYNLLPGAFLACSLLFTGLASGQVSASPERFSPLPDGYVERARIMLADKNYAGVIDQLNSTEAFDMPLSPAEKEEALYMLAVAYYHRGDPQCLNLLNKFTRIYPASLRSLQATLLQGDYYFFDKDYIKALDIYSSIDFDRLNKADLPLYSYRKALCYVKTGFYDNATPLLQSLKGNAEYSQAADFYLAYIAYAKKDYNTAYNLFSALSSVPEGHRTMRKRAAGTVASTGLEAAYYMTQIEYIRGEYDNVITHGMALLQNSPVPELMPEMNRIVGMSFFKRGNYGMARAYLENYLKEAQDSPLDETVYALGVCDYNDGDYAKAEERFRTLTGLNNDIAQSAWLYLGQCAVQHNSPTEAAIAFEKAAKMDYDRNVSEAALYNYAAAVTRGGSVPFSSSASLLEQFLNNYPGSKYSRDVEEYLATAYMKERNYDKALKYLQSISNPDSRIRKLYAQALYQSGVENVMGGNYAKAADSLAKAAESPGADKELKAQASLWLGDALYATGQYARAANAYRKAADNLAKSADRTLALYNIAYCSYQEEKYSSAASLFEKAVNASPALPAPLKGDAIIRMADCQYYTGNYAAAARDYATAISAGYAEADYAAYRKAVMTGLAGDTSGKLSQLAKMQTDYPTSKWIPAAMMEEAMTLQALGNTAKASDIFKLIARKYPENTIARKAELNNAVALMQAGKKEEAAASYRNVIRNWPASEEAEVAHDDLRAYYASNGGLKDYADFLSKIPGAKQLDTSEIEKLAFDGAENAFADSGSTTLLERYIADYPDGKYLAPALLDLAQSLYSKGKEKEALMRLNSLVELRKYSAQYPEALMLKGEILEKSDEQAALATYRELENAGTDFLAEAYSGIMRTTTNPQERLKYARLTARTPGIDSTLADEAAYHEAHSLILLGKTGEGIEILKRLSSNPSTAMGAKSAVELGRHYLDSGDLKNAEATLLAFTDSGSGQQYQLALGFIALADTYLAKGNKALAREYIISLRDNYPGSEPDIADMIAKRLKNW